MDVEDGIPMEQIKAEASMSTVKRWAREFREKATQAAGDLKSLLYTIFNKTIGEIAHLGMGLFGLIIRILQ